jgi:hypothetical protein
MEAPALHLLADREKVGINSDTCNLKKSVMLISQPDVNVPRQARLDQITNSIRIVREIQAQRQIISSPKRNDSERHFSPHEGPGDLSNSAIAACDHHQIRVCVSRLRGSSR